MSRCMVSGDDSRRRRESIFSHKDGDLLCADLLLEIDAGETEDNGCYHLRSNPFHGITSPTTGMTVY